MGYRLVSVLFPDGTQMYADYSTVSDCASDDLFVATPDDADWIDASDSRNEFECRIQMIRDKYPQHSQVIGAPTDVEDVVIAVREHDARAWKSRASRLHRSIVGPMSLDEATRLEQERLRKIDRISERTSKRIAYGYRKLFPLSMVTLCFVGMAEYKRRTTRYERFTRLALAAQRRIGSAENE